MNLIPSSAAISETHLDFGESAEYAKSRWNKIEEFSKEDSYWKGTRLHFLTESIQPKIESPTRPRVMLLFSNPHPESVKTGLFMSEKSSRRFWEKILHYNKQPYITHDFRWDPKGIDNTVSLLLSGNYGNDKSPLLFLECLYQIPSNSPKDLKKLFERTDDFDRYLHRPSLERIGTILDKHNIKVVLVFTGETYESIVGKTGITKYSRQNIRSSVEKALNTGNEKSLWEDMDKFQLREQVNLPNLNHKCTAIKVMDTRAKDWGAGDGHSTFSIILDYALQYAKEVG